MAALTRALTIQSGSTRRIQQAQVLDVAAGIVASNDSGTLQSLSVEAAVGGSIDIGTTAASGTINIGRTGQTVNFPGLVNFTSTTASPDVTFTGDVQIGSNPYDGDTLSIYSHVDTDLIFATGSGRSVYVADNGSGAGYGLTVAAGKGTTAGSQLTLGGGDTSVSGTAGNVAIFGGSALAVGTGGDVQINGGAGSVANGSVLVGTSGTQSVSIGAGATPVTITGSAISVTGDTTFADDILFTNTTNHQINPVIKTGTGVQLSVAGGSGTTGGGQLVINGGSATVSGNGGNLQLAGGSADGVGVGGTASLLGGDAGAAGTGGNVVVDAGAGVAVGGTVSIGASAAASVSMGNATATVSITGSANSVTGDTTFADDIFFTAGAAHVVQVNTDAGAGGALSIASGSSSAAAGGALSITAGGSTVGAGANVTMRGGQAGNNAAGGDVYLKGGLTGTGFSTYGNVYLGEDETSNVYVGSATGAGVSINHGTPGNAQDFWVYSNTLQFMGGALPYTIKIVDQATSNADGTQLQILAAKGNGTGEGGDLQLIGGAGGATNGGGGSTIVLGGAAIGTGLGGAGIVKGGDSPSGAGGDVFLEGGAGGASNGIVRIGQTSTSAINLYANTVVQNGATLSAAAGGMIDLPLNFEIGGLPTDSTGLTGVVTATALNAITQGPTSNGDPYHTHPNLVPATPSIVQVSVTPANGEVFTVGMPVALYDSGAGAFAYPADADAANRANAIGLSVWAGTGDGVTARNVQVAGLITVAAGGFAEGVQPGAAYVGKPVWYSTTAGKLVYDPLDGAFPTAALSVVQKVGIVMNAAGSILVQIGDAVTL